MVEVYVHLYRLEELIKGKPTNVKVNYADQYDVRVLLDAKKYVFVKSREGSNILTVRKKKLKDLFWFNKKSN